MLNLLIAYCNLQKLQMVQNYISQNIPDVRIGYVAKNGKEALEAIKKNDYDAVLMESCLPIYDVFDILPKLPQIKQMVYRNSFIVLSSNENIVKNLKKHELVHEALLSTCPLSEITLVLSKLAKLDKKEQRNVKY